jgi:hypothetical protein
MQLPLKSKRLEAMREWLYEHPKTTLALVLFLFFFITLPAWFASVWQLFTGKPFFVWLAEGMKTMEFSAYWITVPLGVLAFLFVVYLLWSGRQTAGVNKSSKDDKLVVVAESQNSEHTSDPHIEEIADYQRKTLRRYVLVENCEINSSSLSEGKLYIEFIFNLVNYSMYYVSIPMVEGEPVKGSIRFKGDMLSGEAKLSANEVKNCPPHSRKLFIIRQWISRDEAAEISQALEKSGNLFDFSEADVYVSGGDKHPNVETDKLDLTRGMQNADLENKIVQLEALQKQHQAELIEWNRRRTIVEKLRWLAGRGDELDWQLERQIERKQADRQPLPTGDLKRWLTELEVTLRDSFGETGVTSFYKGNAGYPIPESFSEQQNWLHVYRKRLTEIIMDQSEEWWSMSRS